MTGRAMTACLIACCLAAPAARGGDVFDGRAAEFARKIDVDALELLGAQQSGRTAILDTLARGQLRQMCGSSDVESLPAVFAYLELYFNAGRYVDRPVIHIRERQMRGFIERELTGKAAKAFARTSRISPATLLHEEAWNILARSGRAREADRSRARGVGSLRNALAELAEKKQFRLPIDRLSARYSSYLAVGILRVVPTGDEGWLALEEALITREGRPNPSPPPAAAKWAEMGQAWRRRDAEGVNRAIGELSELLPRAAGKTYPSLRTRKLEYLYNWANQGTFVWAGFAISLVLLIVAAATSRRWARLSGMVAFGASTAVLLTVFIVRWVVSGKAWYLPPIMNQYEAVIGAALLGAAVAIVLEIAWQKNYFALSASLYATISLLACVMFPDEMSAGIRAMPGILSSPIMAVHVAVIIVGHALAGMTLVISLVYVFGAIGSKLAATRDRPASRPSSPPDLRPTGELSTLGEIDRCNLIVAQLACWTVVMGTLLGAYWGDFAWGRWWGWDPKETWALITSLIYVAVVHVRFVTPVRWRGWATAIGCILGCGVMLFNWIIVNYVLAGMHSYA